MSNIEKINLISIDIIKSKILGIDNQKLLNEISNTRGDIDETFLEDRHHTYYEDKRYPFGHVESEKLINKLTENVSNILKREMVLSEIWTLTLEYGQSVAAHSHKSNTHLRPEEYFSIAYYPSAPENSADLIFLVNAANTIESSVVIKPETSDLIIFNSYLMHMTNRHRNKTEPRVVISANFIPKNPDVSPTQDWSAYSRRQDNGLGGYDRCYALKIITPFGSEDATLGITGSIAEVFNHSGKYLIEKFTETDGSFDAHLFVDTPMIADVRIQFFIDQNGKIDGSLMVGEFAKYRVIGVKL